LVRDPEAEKLAAELRARVARSRLGVFEHRRGDLAGGHVGNCGRGLFEYEQACIGDLACERCAVADREERIAAAGMATPYF